MSISLRPQGLQHTRLPRPSPTPGACSNSCPSSQWRYPPILKDNNLVNLKGTKLSERASSKRLDTIWFHLHNILETIKLQKWRMICDFPGIRDGTVGRGADNTREMSMVMEHTNTNERRWSWPRLSEVCLLYLHQFPGCDSALIYPTCVNRKCVKWMNSTQKSISYRSAFI